MASGSRILSRNSAEPPPLFKERIQCGVIEMFDSYPLWRLLK